MQFFKLIKENNIFGVISNYNFRKYQKKYDRIIFSDINSAEFIEYKDLFYRDSWLDPYPPEANGKITVEYIDIKEINQEEYNILKETLETEKQIQEQEQPAEEQILPPAVEEEQTPIEPDITLQYVKKVKIKELQRANQEKIKQGFDITLENGKSYHLAFDNTGLFNLIMTVTAQQESQENISFILQKMNEFKQQCDSYCNSLIQQVQLCNDIKEVSNIKYQDKKS